MGRFDYIYTKETIEKDKNLLSVCDKFDMFYPNVKFNFYDRHWKDIDLFVGGVSERLISGAAFGPTFACINGIQFYNFKYGDRFYFEHGYQAGSFTPGIHLFIYFV